ncbi:MAG: hypothetical protein IRZ16_12040 [Myxococcaceae bacterium]|nr:hypothetical protein [Myxococcaceae bacterium]
MGRFEFAIGLRLHFLIFAALPYASQVMGLLEDLDLECPPLGSIGIGQLIARIDRSWDIRSEIRAKIHERVPALRARALQTQQMLLRLVNEKLSGRAGVEPLH